jgi:SIR2-like domain
MTQEVLAPEYQAITRAILNGRAILFLGAGVNLCGRPVGAGFKRGEYLPSGAELTAHLAGRFEFPEGDPCDLENLLHVSQWVSLVNGWGLLYEELRRLFDADYPPTTLHRFLAQLPGLLNEKGCRSPYQLIVTTNYDDVLERAYEEAGQPFDLVAYIAEGDNRGRFLHRAPGGQSRVIENPNEYLELPLDRDENLSRPTILKMHGAVNRIDADLDSYVITEDDYIDYLTRADITSLVPVTLARKLRRSSILFLGYGLHDWNLRVILHRMWGELEMKWASWAVQRGPRDLEIRYWRKRGVDILDVSLEDFIEIIDREIRTTPCPEVGDG